MFIRIKHPTGDTALQSTLEKDTVILNVLFSALFLCPRPTTPGQADDIAPLPFAANPLTVPSVFLGLMLGLPAQQLKSIVPALINHRKATAAYFAIAQCLIETAAPDRETQTLMSSPKRNATINTLYEVDRIYYEKVLSDSNTVGQSRMHCEAELSDMLQTRTGWISPKYVKFAGTLFEKHKRLTRLPDSMPSSKARQVV